ncbi:MAG: sigma-70 family RNA polymerase sigma factor [Gemmatimonadaceae bacterium]
MGEDGEVTRLLVALAGGDRQALDRLLPLIYDELHRIARRQMRNERDDHTLASKDLVHEAYLKLAGVNGVDWQNRAHFLAIAAQAMRRILVNHAVSRSAQKRGGVQQKISLSVVDLPGKESSDELLALHEALTRLEEVNERHARIVECRFFAGMSIEETAEALGRSPATVKRDWIMARAWLHRELAE